MLNIKLSTCICIRNVINFVLAGLPVHVRIDEYKNYTDKETRFQKNKNYVDLNFIKRMFIWLLYPYNLTTFG